MRTHNASVEMCNNFVFIIYLFIVWRVVRISQTRRQSFKLWTSRLFYVSKVNANLIWAHTTIEFIIMISCLNSFFHRKTTDAWTVDSVLCVINGIYRMLDTEWPSSDRVNTNTNTHHHTHTHTRSVSLHLALGDHDQRHSLLLLLLLFCFRWIFPFTIERKQNIIKR